MAFASALDAWIPSHIRGEKPAAAQARHTLRLSCHFAWSRTPRSKSTQAFSSAQASQPHVVALLPHSMQSLSSAAKDLTSLRRLYALQVWQALQRGKRFRSLLSAWWISLAGKSLRGTCCLQTARPIELVHSMQSLSSAVKHLASLSLARTAGVAGSAAWKEGLLAAAGAVDFAGWQVSLLHLFVANTALRRPCRVEASGAFPCGNLKCAEVYEMRAAVDAGFAAFVSSIKLPLQVTPRCADFRGGLGDFECRAFIRPILGRARVAHGRRGRAPARACC